MKKFLLQFLIFSLLVIVLFAITWQSGNTYISKKLILKVRKDVSYVVLGHSHPESSFNDSIINNLQNFASSGECYMYTYAKLEKLFAQNSQVKTVFVEFTNNQADKSMDQWIWCNRFLYKFPTYAPLLTASDYQLIARHNFPGFLDHVTSAEKRNIDVLVHRNFNYSKKLGGFISLKRFKTDSLLKNISTLKYEDTGESVENLEYLDKIIALCNKKGKKIILVRSPEHPLFPGLANEARFQRILHSRYNGIEFLDFKNFPLNTQEFADLEHLNYLGAKKFSIWFNDLMIKGLMNMEDKQSFVASQLNTLTKPS